MASKGWGIFSKRRRFEGHAVLSLSADRVAVLARSKDGRSLRAAERPAGEDAAAALAAIVSETGASGMSCEWVLDIGTYALMQVDKPAVPQDEWVSALKWKVRDLIGFPIEDAVMDAFEVPGLESRGRPSTLYLAVARKDELRPKIAAIESAGLHLQRIGIADLAWAEALKRVSPIEDSQAGLVLDARGGSMLVLREGTLFVARRFEFDAEDQRAIREPQPERSGRLFERIALELQRTLDYFDRTHQRQPPRRLVVFGGIEGLDGLDASLKGALGLDVQYAQAGEQWPALAGFEPASAARLASLAATLDAGATA